MVKITEIKLAEAGIKKYLLFYSASQFFSFFVSVAIAILLVSGVGYFMMGAKMISAASILVALLCALPSVLLARQAVFRIEGPWRLQGASMLEDRLDASGFKKTVVTAKEVVYKKNMPKFLQWEKSYINISRENSFVTVTGPYGALLGFRRFLLLTLRHD